jgi:YidC/Oxa1 family membrane protein insertase
MFLGPVGDFFNLILNPLYYAVSAVMLAWHWLFTQIGLDPEGGTVWALSIIGLTIVIRACLIPLFVKQIKASRNMQLIQPKVKELQKKFGHDRERLAQETMKLYKDAGTNPFASCLPILLQMPIFFALFRLIDEAADGHGHGFLTDARAQDFGQAHIFGELPIARSFTDSGGQVAVQVVAAILVLAMTATTFLTQRQLMAKNMPKDALTGPYAQQQKMLLYVLPVVFAVGGIAFPIGVLLYWTTSNLWTMGQQFYVIRNNPAPGTEAERMKAERDARKAAGKAPAGDGGSTDAAPGPGTKVEEDPAADRRPPQRQQPQRQSKRQRQAKSRGGPSSGASPAGNKRNQNDKRDGNKQ